MLAEQLTRAAPVLQLAAIDDPRWAAFIESHPEATFFHHPAWSRVLAEAYGYRPFLILQADEAGDIVAGLPVLDVRGAFRGRRMIALPFTDYCPPLAIDIRHLRGFVQTLRRWHADAGASLEVRGVLLDGDATRQFQVGVRHLLRLDRDPDRVFSAFHPNVRRLIRRCGRAGLRVRIGSAASDLTPFYELHWQTRRRLGVPLQPLRFFECLWQRVIEAGLGFVAFVYLDDRPVAADLFLAWNGTMVGKFNASDRRFWSLHPNNLVVWAGIEWGCRNGYRRLDFGKTECDNGGLRAFKDGFGAVEVPLVYTYLGGSPGNGGDGLAARVLTRIIQVAPPVVCRLSGELLYRHVP